MRSDSIARYFAENNPFSHHISLKRNSRKLCKVLSLSDPLRPLREKSHIL